MEQFASGALAVGQFTSREDGDVYTATTHQCSQWWRKGGGAKGACTPGSTVQGAAFGEIRPFLAN